MWIFFFIIFFWGGGCGGTEVADHDRDLQRIAHPKTCHELSEVTDHDHGLQRIFIIHIAQLF